MIESVQTYLTDNAPGHGAAVEADLRAFWESYEGFYRGTRDQFPIDSVLESTHEILTLRYAPPSPEYRRLTATEVTENMEIAFNSMAESARELQENLCEPDEAACCAAGATRLARWTLDRVAENPDLADIAAAAQAVADSITEAEKLLKEAIEAVRIADAAVAEARAESPLTDEDIDEAFHTVEAQWDY
jgi:hypothetical protein